MTMDGSYSLMKILYFLSSNLTIFPTKLSSKMIEKTRKCIFEGFYFIIILKRWLIIDRSKLFSLLGDLFVLDLGFGDGLGKVWENFFHDFSISGLEGNQVFFGSEFELGHLFVFLDSETLFEGFLRFLSFALFFSSVFIFGKKFHKLFQIFNLFRHRDL